MDRCKKCSNEFDCQECVGNYRNFYVPKLIPDPDTGLDTWMPLHKCSNINLPTGEEARGIPDHLHKKMYHKCSDIIKNCEICQLVGDLNNPSYYYRCLQCKVDMEKDKFIPEVNNHFVFNRITKKKIGTLYDVTGKGNLQIKFFTNVKQDSCDCRYNQFWSTEVGKCRLCGSASIGTCRTCETSLKCTSCYNNMSIRKEPNRDVWSCVKECGDGFRLKPTKIEVVFSYRTNYAENWDSPVNRPEIIEQK